MTYTEKEAKDISERAYFDNPLGNYSFEYWWLKNKKQQVDNEGLDLRQLSRNNSDCYADTHSYSDDTVPPTAKVEGDVVQAMIEDKFVDVVTNLHCTFNLKQELLAAFGWVSCIGEQFFKGDDEDILKAYLEHRNKKMNDEETR